MNRKSLKKESKMNESIMNKINKSIMNLKKEKKKRVYYSFFILLLEKRICAVLKVLGLSHVSKSRH